MPWIQTNPSRMINWVLIGYLCDSFSGLGGGLDLFFYHRGLGLYEHIWSFYSGGSIFFTTESTESTEIDFH